MIPRMKRSYVLLLVALLLGCTVPAVLPTATPTPTSTPTASPTSTAPSTDTGWLELVPGMEQRRVRVATGGGEELVSIVRLDPTRFVVRVRYTPGAAQPVAAWAAQSGALLTVNGGYFTAENLVTGLHISEGERYGVSYGDFAGMLAAPEVGPTRVRWLREQPYDPAEPLSAAVQSFPVLVKPGGVMGFPADADDGRLARRTVVAQDESGRLLFIIAPRGYFSLHTLAVWLAASDLEIDVALNLDGGTSAGLWTVDGPQINSLIPVPAVITVE